MAVVLLCIALVTFAVQKYWLEAKTAATLTGKASRGRMLIEDRSVTVPLTALCSLAALFVIVMYICVPIGALHGLFPKGLMGGIYGSAAILIIVFVMRSLPTGTRSGISALRQIDKSIEESAYDMGADSFTVFMTVTLPLIKDSFLSGLVTPQFLLITAQINEFAEKGSYSIACAFATILILITYGSVPLMNVAIRFFGISGAFKEGE